jgi:hypothetical protein
MLRRDAATTDRNGREGSAMAKHKTRECRSCREEINAKAKVCPHCRAKQGWTLGAKLGLGFILLLVLPPMFIESTPDSSAPKSTAAAAAPSRANAPSATKAPSKARKRDVLDAVKLDFTWSKSGFDNIMEATFTVNNQSKRDIKDIEIECVHFAPSGTKIDSNRRTIYEVVKAGGARTFPKFNMGFIHTQAKSTSCGIRDIALR